MLTHLQIKNFKAWRDTGPMRLAPLTVIFGANSSGKSSLGHLLLALKQTSLLADRKRAMHLGDENTLIDLGTFADCLYGHDQQQVLDFTLRWRLPQALTVKNSLNRNETFHGEELELAAQLLADKTLVVTGTLARFTRDEIQDLIRQHGGRAASSVSKSTDFVVPGLVAILMMMSIF